MARLCRESAVCKFAEVKSWGSDGGLEESDGGLPGTFVQGMFHAASSVTSGLVFGWSTCFAESHSAVTTNFNALSRKERGVPPSASRKNWTCPLAEQSREAVALPTRKRLRYSQRALLSAISKVQPSYLQTPLDSPSDATSASADPAADMPERSLSQALLKRSVALRASPVLELSNCVSIRIMEAFSVEDARADGRDTTTEMVLLKLIRTPCSGGPGDLRRINRRSKSSLLSFQYFR